MDKLKFITIEGVDGAGKSTFIPSIKSYLEERGFEVVLTREPGGTKLGKSLREMILVDKTLSLDAFAETLLLFADRAQHLKEVIVPALDAGKFVICDRFADSTLAYQSYAKGVPEQKVKMLQDLVLESVRPGLTYIFDVPLNVSKSRLQKTGKSPDKMESQGDRFFDNVISGYKEIVKKNPDRCKLIDSSSSIEETRTQVLEQLDIFLEGFQKKNQLKNRL